MEEIDSTDRRPARIGKGAVKWHLNPRATIFKRERVEMLGPDPNWRGRMRVKTIDRKWPIIFSAEPSSLSDEEPALEEESQDDVPLVATYGLETDVRACQCARALATLLVGREATAGKRHANAERTAQVVAVGVLYEALLNHFTPDERTELRFPARHVSARRAPSALRPWLSTNWSVHR